MISTLLLLALAADYPSATISNGAVTARFLLPDAEKGSYRGTRFDWAGIIESLTYKNHEYFGQWNPKDDPKLHDSISGPVEEYFSDTVPGFDEAKPGGPFMRIGIGAVAKPSDGKPYQRFETYQIVDPGKRTLRQGKDWIEFGHQLKVGSYAYDYHKTIRLEKTGFVIEHVLKNTGGKTLDTLSYDHNFFVIDHETVGPDIVIHFAWPPKPDKPLPNGGEIKGDEIRYQRELAPGESVAADLSGYGAYDVRIENQKTHAGVRITSDQPLNKMYFWSIRSVACPEPYIHLTIAPKATFKWQIRYDLYAQ